MDMIEKVARALCAKDGLDWDAQADGMTSGGGGDDEQDGYREKATAAIEAMGDPTPEMKYRGRTTNNSTGEKYAEATWRAMIAAALGR